MRIGVFIPVRLDSTRLPQKALRDIMGKPAIQHLAERVGMATTPEMVVICTSTDATDDELEVVARRSGAGCFRGSKDDLLDRFLQAALQYQLDLIVNVDGDDILVDPEQVDAVAAKLEESGADFVTCEGLPFGAAPVGLRVAALKAVCQLKDQSDTATGWGRYFTDSGRFKTVVLRIEDEELRHPEIRMTLDYDEDLEFFRAVFRELYEPNRPVRLRDAVKLIVSRPDIAAINSGLEERYWTHFHQAQPPSIKSF
jgi:spore coat polysaccharide biosynthesis protein SpsF (cytidylyltransferase family)